MSALALQHCSKLSHDAAAMNNDQASTFIQQLDPQWLLDTKEQSISFTYAFENYYQTIAFVNVIAQIAHQQDHHPELRVAYNRCTVTYSTHKVDGLSINDFICAAKINAAQNL
jgi:4a-hydroxytetrahydrobiopterin dehydratase